MEICQLKIIKKQPKLIINIGKDLQDEIYYISGTPLIDICKFIEKKLDRLMMMK